MSPTLTCVACQVGFNSADAHREHYKSDWHRYNLKRKVAELSPINEQEFIQRLARHLERNGTPTVDENSFCGVCKKHFSSKLTFENHLKSKKHLELTCKNPELANKVFESIKSKPDVVQDQGNNHVDPDDDDDDDDDDEEEWEDVEDEPQLEVNECLFCSFKSDHVIDNVKHMTNKHSFFIPDVEYLSDLEGLISYLAEKVSIGNLCLWCNEKGKSFHTTKSVQQHMLAKGHCKIFFESESLFEFADYYDYSSSYPDNEATNAEEEVDVDVLNDEGFELVLPSGATIGHRALMRYYKQNVPPTREHRSGKVAPVLAYYRALGWKQTPQAVAERNARDVKYMQYIRAKQHMKQGIKNNKLQKFIHTQRRW